MLLSITFNDAAELITHGDVLQIAKTYTLDFVYEARHLWNPSPDWSPHRNAMARGAGACESIAVLMVTRDLLLPSIANQTSTENLLLTPAFRACRVYLCICIYPIHSVRAGLKK